MAQTSPSPSPARTAATAAEHGSSVQVAGRHVQVGDALRTRIVDELTAGVGKYFERGGEADVTVSREGHNVCIDVVMRLASGQRLEARGLATDAHASFSAALVKIETRIRRYKRRLKNHHPHLGGPLADRAESVAYTVLRASDEEDDGEDEWGRDGSAGSGAPAAAIIAESQSQVKTMPVFMAVMELDLTDAPVLMFRNAAHGGLSVVYRRRDGNVGWLDPERKGADVPGEAASKTARPGAANGG